LQSFLVTEARAQILGDTSFFVTITAGGKLTVGGKACFESTILNMDIKNASSIEADTLVFFGINTVTLNSATIDTKTYKCLTGTKTIRLDDLFKWQLSPLGLHRVGAEISHKDDSRSLVLTSKVYKLPLTWEGTESQNWDL
jgi:hypothetical protein